MPPASQTYQKGAKYWYQFPPNINLGMDNDTNYRASLHFRPMKVNGATVSSFLGDTDLSAVLESIMDKGVELFKSHTGQNKRKEFAEQNRVLDGPAAAAAEAAGEPSNVRGLEPIIRNGKNTDFFGDLEGRHVSLYLPMNVQQMENVSVGPENLGPVGGAVSAAIAGGSGSLASIASSAVAGGLSGIGDMMTGNVSGEFGSLLANRLVSKLNTSAGLGVTNATRIQVSPNTRSIFKQVNIREWAFTFQMIPTSEEESIVIENIIDFFRMEQLPVELGAGGVSMAYRFPNLMTIEANYTSEDGDIIPIITRFLPAYLQAVDVTYNTTAMSFYENGKYHDATMSLKFIEYRPLNKHDILLEREYLNKTSALAPDDIMKDLE